MLMLKQICTEMRYRKIKIGKVILVLSDIVLSLFSHSWMGAMIYIWCSLDFLNDKGEQAEMPEVICFLPMEQNARQRYVQVRGYVENGVLSLYVAVCLLVTQLPLWGTAVNWPALSYTVVVVLDFWFNSCEKSILKENAAYRKMEMKAFREMCCPRWYQVLYKITMGIRIIIILTAFYWCGWFNPELESFSFSTGWLIGLFISLTGLLTAHLFRMKYILFAINMGDYNAGAGEKDGES